MFTSSFLFYHVYFIAIVKFSNRSIENLFNVDKGTCMDSHRLSSKFVKWGNLVYFDTLL